MKKTMRYTRRLRHRQACKYLECGTDRKHLTFLPGFRGHQENDEQNSMPGSSNEDHESDDADPMPSSTRSESDPQRPVRSQVNHSMGTPISF